MIDPRTIIDQLMAAERGWLFLDYDGTLDGFAPTPDDVRPNPEVIRVVKRLTAAPRLNVAVISGRRLQHMRALLPVPDLLLAGTYGVELQLPDGRSVNRLALDRVRPDLDRIKPIWSDLIAGRAGFYLEDKRWSLALHARFAAEADRVVEQARAAALAILSTAQLRLLDGDRFLEVAPALADKQLAVDDILRRFPRPGALPVYVGDDDKDEEAFGAVQQYGGRAIVVAERPRATRADSRLPDPPSVRAWLTELADRLSLTR